MRRQGGIAWGAAVLASLCFCLGTAEAQGKDTIRFGVATKLDNLDQYKSTQRVTIQMGYLMWDPLVTRDPDTGRINPHLAQSWRTIDDTTWEFKLVPGVKFHNGNPLNAECVRFTLEDRILAPEQKSPQRGNFTWIQKVEVVDDLTFRIVTQKPYPIVLERLNVLFVYDPMETKAKGDDWVSEHPMGTGPYKFVRWERGSELLMTANPDYWQKGLPKVKNIVVRELPETSTRVAELVSGGLDFAADFGSDQWDAIKKARNAEPMDVPVLRVNFWQFDGSGKASKTPLTDKRVRQAICHAIDRKAIIEKVLKGFGDPMNAPIHPMQFGFDPTVKEYEYNPEKAKALLKEAGYPDGFEVDLWNYIDYQHQPDQAAMGYLSKVGIKVNIKDYRGNIGQAIKLRNAGKITGIGNWTWGSYNIFDADAILPAWFLSSEEKNYNPDPELDAWLTEARFSMDPEKRKALYARAQKKIVEEAYWMPFFVVHIIYGRHKDLDVVVGRDEVPRLQHAAWKK
jgi:peptide/nickel transport system substrate-binding protein